MRQITNGFPDTYLLRPAQPRSADIPSSQARRTLPIRSARSSMESLGLLAAMFVFKFTSRVKCDL